MPMSHSGSVLPMVLFRDVNVRVRDTVCEWMRRPKEKNGIDKPSAMRRRCKVSEVSGIRGQPSYEMERTDEDGA